MSLDIDTLRASGHKPRLHGNGFIQLNLPDNKSRLHIWPFIELVAQKTATRIHNHRFGFTSRVIMGRTFDVRYQLFPARFRMKHYFVVHEAVTRDREDTQLVPVEGQALVDAEVSSVQFLQAGDCYTFPPLEFHEHVPTREVVATIMIKTQEIDIRPQVLVPYGMTPDNDFNRYHSDEAGGIRDLVYPEFPRSMSVQDRSGLRSADLLLTGCDVGERAVQIHCVFARGARAFGEAG